MHRLTIIAWTINIGDCPKPYFNNTMVHLQDKNVKDDYPYELQQPMKNTLSLALFYIKLLLLYAMRVRFNTCSLNELNSKTFTYLTQSNQIILLFNLTK